MPVNNTVSLNLRRPGTPGFAAACAGFDLSAIPASDIAISATDEHDVRAAVRFAADRGLPVAVRTTGHGPVPGVDHGVLVDTRALSSVTVDPARHTAVAGGGVRWAQVLPQTALFGLIPLCGSSPDVGVAAYTLGGGLGPLGRRHGWAADRVRRIRLVTPDGELREVSADSDPELFWALRGGGGGFGVVTEVEFDLVAGDALYGGGLYLPGAAAPELLAAFGRCTATAPDELSLSVAFITFPDLDPIPAPLWGCTPGAWAPSRWSAARRGRRGRAWTPPTRPAGIPTCWTSRSPTPRRCWPNAPPSSASSRTAASRSPL